jgi:uncharacterized protein
MLVQISKGLLTGLIAGFASGLLGVSPGGILVPVISIALGLPQHLAQAVSLSVQVLPTSLAGVSSYFKRGRGVRRSWVAVLACGFVVGGPLGAALTGYLSDRQLRWLFVSYLLLLATLAAFRGSRREDSLSEEPARPRVSWLALLLIGLIAGTSSVSAAVLP